MDMKQAWHAQLNTIRRERNYAPGWVAQTYRKRFQVWPDHRINRLSTAEPTPEVRSYVKALMIRHAKSRKAA